MSVPCFPCSGSFPEELCFGSWAALTVTLSRDRCAWQRLSTTWRGPLPSRPARTRCAASAWRWCMRNPQPRRGGLGSCPTATTRTACPASASGDVPSSSRTPSSSELCDLPWPERGLDLLTGEAGAANVHRAQQSLPQGLARPRTWLWELPPRAAGRTACPLVTVPLWEELGPWQLSPV